MEARRYAFVGALTLLSFSRGSGHAESTPSSAIPLGDSWHCYQVSETYNPRDRSARCFRSSEQCQEFRDEYASGVNEYTTEITGCFEQAKASVVIYFDVMRDGWRSWALPSTEECAETKRFLARSKDHRRISNCQLVGKRLPAPGKLRLELVQPGEGWYCSSKVEHLRACSRDLATCHAFGRSEHEASDDATVVDPTLESICRPQAKASVFTGRKADGDHVAFAIATADACHAIRDRLSLSWTDVSVCKTVGSTQRPRVERADIPDGKGWACYTSVKDGQRGGWCGRSTEDCESSRTTDDELGLNPSACQRAAIAYGHSYAGVFSALPTLDNCEREMRENLEGSRCEPIQ